jgi:hypothetical protein
LPTLGQSHPAKVCSTSLCSVSSTEMVYNSVDKPPIRSRSVNGF